MIPINIRHTEPKGKNIMVNENQVPEYHNNNILGVLLGLFIGALAGAITMLLLAPQSGEDTRMQIRERGIELRNQTTGMMDEAVAQMRLNRNKITMGSRQKAQELLHQGQALVVEQLDHVSEAAQAGKKAIQSS
jgi:gas vesicle protein